MVPAALWLWTALSLSPLTRASFLDLLDLSSQNVLQAPDFSVPTITKHKHHKKPEVDLFSLHKDLVEIESISKNEYAVGVYLAHYLKALNLTVEIQPVTTAEALSATPERAGALAVHDTQIVHDAKTHKFPPRFNVLAYPHHAKTRALLSSHMDVVPPYYNYSRTGDVIAGRGTVDDKSCIAAQIATLHSLRSAGAINDTDLGLLFVVGEETNGVGMRSVNALGRTWEAVIFGEPTESKLVAGHKGIMMFTVAVKGKAAHSGYPWLGANANNILLHALGALEAIGPSLPRSEEMGETTINIGRMSGGVAANVVAEHAEAQMTVRIAAGTPQEVKKMVLEAIQLAVSPDLQDGVAVEVSFSENFYGPVHMDCDIEGFDCITVNYGTDVRNLNGDHKRYLYGPGSILVAHSDHEALNAPELEQAVEDYKKIVLAVLGK